MKKILFSLTVFLISASILTGCFFPLGDLDKLQEELSSWQDEMSRLLESYADMSWPEYSYPEYSYPDYSYPHQSDSTEYSEPYENSEYNEPSHDVPEISYPEISEEESQPEISEESVPTEAIAELYTLDEVRDFLNRKKAEDIFDIQFIYKGDKSELDGATIARITSSCVLYHTVIGNKYDVPRSKWSKKQRKRQIQKSSLRRYCTICSPKRSPITAERPTCPTAEILRATLLR